MIDDGLLIMGSRIIAGSSAKKAASRLESVRQALFADATRAAVMRRALAEHHPAALMILGTSDGMLEKICKNLWLNPPAMLIRIEDVSSEEEMRQAKQTRMSEGKHTIPVPTWKSNMSFQATLRILYRCCGDAGTGIEGLRRSLPMLKERLSGRLFPH